MDYQLFDLRKALDTTSTNGNNVLSPIELSKAITDWARRQPVIRNIIKRIPWTTNQYTWDTQQFMGAAATYADGATLSLTDASFQQNAVAMSYFYQVGYVSGPAMKADQDLVDAMSLRIGGATKAVLRKENSVIYNGDPANATNPGLFAALSASTTFGVAGTGAALSRILMDTMDISLRQEGYTPGVFVVSPGVYRVIKEAAYNNVRFIGDDGDAAVGFSLAPQKALTVGGVPVVMDVYAAVVTTVGSEVLSNVTGNTYKFANKGVYTQTLVGGDQAGTAISSPTFLSGTSTAATSGASYNIDSNGYTNITFGTTVSTPTVSYQYQADNILLLSLDPEDLLIAESEPLSILTDLAKPVQQDATPFRVQEYCVTAVRNPKAHVFAKNVVLPNSISSF